MKPEEMIFELEGPRITRADLRTAAESLGLTFPEEYVEFLLQHNGGVSKLCVSEEPAIRLWRWYSVCRENDPPGLWPLVQYNKILWADTETDSVLAIANSVSDYPVVIKVRGSGKGRIGVWITDADSVDTIKLPFASFIDLTRHLRHSDEFM